MSKATKRKHVTKEVLEDYYVPEEGEEIVKIITGRGNNLHEVVSADDKKYLVSMPTKFRKNVWVKRGDYVVVSSISEGVKVQGEIVYILYNKQIKLLKEENLWPESFCEAEKAATKAEKKDSEHKESRHTTGERNHSDSDDFSSSSDDDDDLFTNPNHRDVIYEHDSDATSSEGESESDDDDDHVTKDDDNNIIAQKETLVDQMNRMHCTKT